VVTKAKKKGGEATTKVLLNDIAAEARAGEILAVVGPSGAGKSTFLDAIAGR
jgi:ABC-type multidrug transport system ATPase subunit